MIRKFRSFLTEAKKPTKAAKKPAKKKEPWLRDALTKLGQIAAKKPVKKEPKPPKQPPSKWSNPHAPGTTIMVFGGMDPVTSGHERLIRTAQKHAQRLGAKLKVITPESDNKEKMKHLKRAFPDVKIDVAPKHERSIVHHVKRAYDDGARDLVVMAGGERVKQYQTFLNNYNGSPATGYRFRSIKVMDAGKKGPGNVSGVEQLGNAHAGDFHRFRASLPTTIAKNWVHSREAFRDYKKHATKVARAAKKK